MSFRRQLRLPRGQEREVMQDPLDFPVSGYYAQQRGPLNTEKPLVLEYRLWTRRGGKATDKDYAQPRNAFH